MTQAKLAIAQCAEVTGPDADGYVWLRLVRKGEDDSLIAVEGETARELLRWRDEEGHKTAECAEVIGSDDGDKVWIRLVAGDKDTRVQVRDDHAQELLKWRNRSYATARRESPRGNVPPPAEDQSG
jgi:hypothetical protein